MATAVRDFSVTGEAESPETVTQLPQKAPDSVDVGTEEAQAEGAYESPETKAALEEARQLVAAAWDDDDSEFQRNSKTSAATKGPPSSPELQAAQDLAEGLAMASLHHEHLVNERDALTNRTEHLERMVEVSVEQLKCQKEKAVKREEQLAVLVSSLLEKETLLAQEKVSVKELIAGNAKLARENKALLGQLEEDVHRVTGIDSGLRSEVVDTETKWYETEEYTEYTIRTYSKHGHAWEVKTRFRDAEYLLDQLRTKRGLANLPQAVFPALSPC